MTAPKRAETQAAAALLREVLAKVDAGELEAPGRRGRAVVARIESAALGLEVASGVGGRDP
jgi:hypothetical protein